MFYTEIESPIGTLLLAGFDGVLTRIGFQSGPRPVRPPPHWRHDASPFQRAISEMKAYFSGELQVFTLQLAPEGTDFQLKVWQALSQIPYGETRSYGELAQSIGRPKASRAVGAANGQNPLPIIIPCHRVIGNDGSLTGFGGGMNTKAALLELEAQNHDGPVYQLDLLEAQS